MGLSEVKEIAAGHVMIALDDVGLDDSIGVNGGNSSLQKLSSLISASGRTVVAEGAERPEQADFCGRPGTDGPRLALFEAASCRRIYGVACRV